jgi:hypothetical protein
VPHAVLVDAAQSDMCQPYQGTPGQVLSAASADEDGVVVGEDVWRAESSPADR